MAINPLQLPPISSTPQLNWAPLDKVGTALAAARQQQQLADAGSATNADGTPDYKAIVKNLFGIGQVDKAAEVLKATQQPSLLEGLTGLTNIAYPPPAATQPTSAPQQQPIGQPASTTMPVRPSAPAVGGGDAKDGTSIVGIIGAAGIPDDKAGPMIVGLSNALKIDPNAPITDPAMRQRVAQVAQSRAQPPQGGQPQQPMQGPPQPGQQPPVQQQGPPQPPQQGLAGPLMRTPPQGAPQQMPPQGQPQQLPQMPPQQQGSGQGQPQPQSGQYPQPGAIAAPLSVVDPSYGGLVPAGRTPEQQLAVLKAVASRKLATGLRGVADRENADIAALQARLQPTESTKNYEYAVQQGFRGTKDQWDAQKEGDKAYEAKSQESWIKKYDTLQANGEKAQTEIPQLNLIKQQINDPNFYSGFGSKYNLLWKQMVAGAAQAFPGLGLNPETAFSQEAFGKVVSGNILSQLGQLKGMGQIRVAEINLAKDASAAGNYSVPANKVLVEIATRMHQRSADLAELAQNYNGGRLDAGFDKVATAYNKANPLFSDNEIKDWHKIIGQDAPQPAGSNSAAPQSKAQQFGSPSDVNAAVKAGKLKSGDTFLDPNNVLRRVP